MAVTADGIMTQDGQELPFARDLREALAAYAKRTWRVNTTLAVSKAWALDKSTAKNLLKGHASDATITKVLRSGGWDMAITVIGAVIGQSLDDHLQAQRRRNAENSIRLRNLARDLRSSRSVPADGGVGDSLRVARQRTYERG